MWLSVGLLIATFTALSCASESKQRDPVGLVNDGTNCYISAVLQALYHLPSVREAVVGRTSNSIVHPMLASLFYRMTASTEAQGIDADFLGTVRKVCNKKDFDLDTQNDAQAFLTYLLGDHLPWISDELMTLEVEETMIYQDVKLSTKIARETVLFSSILNNASKPVHHALEDTIEDNVEHRITVTDYINHYGQKSLEGLLSSSQSDSASASDTFLLSVTRMRRVVSMPPILVIVGSKYRKPDNSVQDNSSSPTSTEPPTSSIPWDVSTPTNFERTFEFQGKRYHLYSTVVYIPGHYFTHTCVNAAENRWYLLDDSRVSPATEDYDPGHNPFIFFYVEESLLQTWKTASPFTVDQIAPRYHFLGQIFQSLEDGVHLLMRQTHRSLPKAEAIIDFVVPPKFDLVSTIIDDEESKASETMESSPGANDSTDIRHQRNAQLDTLIENQEQMDTTP